MISEEAGMPGSAMPGGRLYQQIANDLREQIRRGELAPGDQIPTEAELMERYDVSRNTVRKAVEVLTAVGLLDTVTTRGTFVRERHPLTLTATRYERERGVGAKDSYDAYKDELEAQGRESHAKFEFQIVPAVREVADRLRVETDALVVCRKMTLFSDNRPNAIQSSYYPLDIAQGTEIMSPKDIERGVIRVLAEVGHEEIGHKDEISPRMPTEEEDRALLLGAGVPVLEWIRTAYSDKRPVRLTWTVYAGNGVKLVYELGDVKAARLATGQAIKGQKNSDVPDLAGNRG